MAQKSLLPRGTKLLPRHITNLRAQAASQAGALIKELTNHALGNLKCPQKQKGGEYEIKPYEMSMSQVKAAEIVLKKAVPDLQQAELEVVTDTKPRSKEEIVQGLAAMFEKHPDLRELLLSNKRDDEVVVDVADVVEVKGDG